MDDTLTDISETDHLSQKCLKILSLSTTYPFIHFKEKSNNGNAVLYYTTVNGRLEVFKCFFGQVVKKLKLEQKLQCITSTGAQGRTFLHFAAGQGSLEVIKLLLDNNGCPLLTGLKLLEFISIKDDLGCAALHLAVKNNQYDVVECLLDFGGNNLSSLQQYEHIALGNQEGRTALHLAAMSGNFEIVKLLVKKAKLVVSDTSKFLILEDNFGNTALQRASLNEYYQIVKFLLNNDDNDVSHLEILMYEKLNYTLMFSSFLIDDEEDCQYFKSCLDNALTKEQQRKALTASDESRRSVFHYAAYYNHIDTFKLLLNNTTLSGNELKKVLMDQDDFGYTPFYLAVQEAHCEIVKLVVNKFRTLLSFEELKNFFEHKNIFGTTALDIAIESGHQGLVAFLLEEMEEFN